MMLSKMHYAIGLVLFLLTACTKESGEASLSNSTGIIDGGGSSNQNEPGVITAGEWNDLENWDFWQTLLKKDEFKDFPASWSVFTEDRISVKVVNQDALPVNNVLIRLKNGNQVLYSAKTDNTGRAELWPDLFQGNTSIDYTSLSFDVNNGEKVVTEVKPYNAGINMIVLSGTPTAAQKIEVSFVVDATGSMQDELDYLKNELLDVLARVKNDNPNASVLSSSVFYRDEGDDYVTRVSHFTGNQNETTNFIKNQQADGGGDFPEAVHAALDQAINGLQWSSDAKTRLLFLVLDAPPHHNTQVINSLQTNLVKAAEKGIKIIPVTASGINKETEFLMRSLSACTNGTYVFITDHSGIGNSHLEPTVGAFKVEFLNKLMVRLINKYAL